MMWINIKSTRWWRLCASMAVLTLGMGVGGCDLFDGDDDEEVFVPPDEPNILPTYNYSISDNPSAQNLTATIGDGTQAVVVSLGTTLNGSVDVGFDSAGNAFVFAFQLDAGSSVTVNSDAGTGPAFLGTFDGSVDTTMQFPAGSDFPSVGAYSVTDSNMNTAAVTVSSTGVQVVIGANTDSFTWQEFDDLIEDDMAPTLQRQAALAFAVADFVFDLAFNVVDGLNLITDDLLTAPFTENCDMFTGTPPAGVLAQGMQTFTWTGSGSISPGDTFFWDFTDCWEDDSGDDDTLLRGGITLDGYNETIDANNNLTRIGFDSVIFNFSLAETFESAPGVFEINDSDTVAVTGAFMLDFTAP